MRVYYSCTEVEPNDKSEGKLEWPRKITIGGEKGPKSNLRIFKHSNLYLTLQSSAGCKVMITTTFPALEGAAFRKKNLNASTDSQIDGRDSAELIAKPIPNIMNDYEKGKLKLNDVQLLVSEAKRNR